MISEIYWDLDGTIWRAGKNVVRKIAEGLGIAYSSELQAQHDSMIKEFDRYFVNQRVSLEKAGKYIEDRMPILYGKSGVQYLTTWTELREQTIIPEAVKVIKTVYASGIQNIVITNWFWKAQVGALKDFHLLEYFEKVYTIDGNLSKSHPERVKEIVKGNTGIVIGDSWTDIQFARKAGIKIILYDEAGEKNFEEGPDYRVSNLLEVLPIIEQ